MRIENRIKKLRIKNFQRVKNLTISFGDITIIRGRSRTGKSSVWRAFMALMSCPQGSFFIKDSESYCLVAVECDRGVVIWKKVRDGSNHYTVKRPEGDIKEWDKCSITPPEVYEILGFYPIQFTEDYSEVVNLQPQGDDSGGRTNFLVSLPGKDSAKVLGFASRLSDIYQGIANCDRDMKRAQKDAKDTKLQLMDLETMAMKYSNLDVQLRDFSDTFEDYNLCKKDREALIDLGKKRDILINRRILVEKKKQRYLKLSDLSGVTKVLSSIQNEVLSVSTITQKLSELRSIKMVTDKKKGELNVLKLSLDKVSQELKVFREENEVCPVCGQEWR